MQTGNRWKNSIKGGEQRFSFIDAEDAAEGIVSMLLSSPKWEKSIQYGMGSVQIYFNRNCGRCS